MRDTSDQITGPTKTFQYTLDARHVFTGNKSQMDLDPVQKFILVADALIKTKQVRIVNFYNPTKFLNNTSEIPNETSQFEQYCKDSHMNKGHSLHYIFKIVSTTTFYKLKQRLMTWIQQSRIYLQITQLQTGHNVTIGWLARTITRFTNLTATIKEIKHRIQSDLPFHLITRVIKQRRKITRALAIECSIEHYAELSQAFQIDMVQQEENFLLYNYMEFVPNRAFGDFTDDLLEEMVVNQRLYLLNVRQIVLHTPNVVYSESWKHDQTQVGDVWRKDINKALTRNNMKMFHSMNSANKDRLQLYTLKHCYSEALKWIEDYQKAQDLEFKINEENDQQKTRNPTFNTYNLGMHRATNTYASVLKKRSSQLFYEGKENEISIPNVRHIIDPFPPLSNKPNPRDPYPPLTDNTKNRYHNPYDTNNNDDETSQKTNPRVNTDRNTAKKHKKGSSLQQTLPIAPKFPVRVDMDESETENDASIPWPKTTIDPTYQDNEDELSSSSHEEDDMSVEENQVSLTNIYSVTTNLQNTQRAQDNMMQVHGKSLLTLRNKSSDLTPKCHI